MPVSNLTPTVLSSPSPIDLKRDFSISSEVKGKQLGMADFLKLLTVQMANQDPLKPVTDTAFIAQMSQFSALESTAGLTKAMNSFAQEQRGMSLLGKEVTVNLNSGQQLIGRASSTRFSEKDVWVTVNGEEYNFNQISRVHAPSLNGKALKTDTDVEKGDKHEIA